MSGPLQQLLGVSSEQQQRAMQDQHNRIGVLGQLLDDPNITLDAKEALAAHLEELTNVPKQKRGLLPLFTSIFHHQQQKEQAAPPQNLYGVNDVVASSDAGKETLDSRIARMTKGYANDNDASQGLVASPLPDRMVRKGSLTTKDLSDMQKFSEFTKEQKVRDQMDVANDARTQARQIAVQTQRGKDALDRLTAQMAGRSKLLTDAERLRAQRKVQELVATGMSPDQAAESVRQGIETDQEFKKAKRLWYEAQTVAIPERTKQAWQRLDNDQLRTEIYRTVAGNQARRDMVKPNLDALMAELRSVRDEVEYHSRYPTDPDQKTALEQAKAHENGILNELWKLNKSDEVAPQLPPSTPMPSRGKGSGTSARPNFNLRQWKADHPNATDAEISAKRNQYVGKYNVIE